MRETRTSGSEGGEAGNSTGLPYPYLGWTWPSAPPSVVALSSSNCRCLL